MDPVLNRTAQAVLEARYLARDARGRLTETPDQMWNRAATAAAGPEDDPRAWTERFRELMVNGLFLPNTPTLINAGRPLGQLSACFVLPVHDSIASIFNTLKQAAQIHQSGGGTGFNFSRLRPAGDQVRSSRGVSSGPVSFMRVYDLATETIKQGGTRRGANMGLLRVDHPDILEFIAAKNKVGLSNFNLSVGLTDRFMAAVAREDDFELINPRTNKPDRRLSAGRIFAALVDSAHRTGEPGAIFLDRINQDNPTPALGPLEGVNPCGEQPLLAYESCNLGSINLGRLTGGGAIDWPGLRRTVRRAVRFLDNIITVNRFPLARIKKVTLANRKIGLGVMGFADLLVRLGLAYDSRAAVDLAGEVMAEINRTALDASEELGRKRGDFPNFGRSIWAGRRAHMRNATVTTIAPTGSISILAGASPGIEPYFALAQKRTILNGQSFAESNGLLLEKLAVAGWSDQAVIDQIAAEGHCRNVDRLPTEIKRLFPTAHQIDWIWHLRIQAAFQKHTANAVSKTINLPAEAEPEAVAQALVQAHELGLKGLTVYRDGSRPGQVLTLGAACQPCNFL